MPPDKVLVVHNRYREPGGEDQAVAQEVALLRARGHTVAEYSDSNDRLDESRPIAAGIEAIWSARSYRLLEELMLDTRPDLAHFHNTFARISPAAYYAAGQAGVPVVQTLHNYRMGCLNAYCSRGGRTCQSCVSRFAAWPGVLRACYRNSRLASLGAAGVGLVHRAIGTYRHQVDAYISTSQFARAIHIRSGVPAALDYVKPNFCQAPPAEERSPSGYALFAGRLCEEKGVRVLLDAWSRLSPPIPLKIAGDGPLGGGFSHIPGVEFLGAVSRERVRDLMLHADFLVQPSLLFENCGLVIIEAFSAGLPCLVSGHGSFAELVEHGRTGLHFPPGDAAALAQRAVWLARNPGAREAMGLAARVRYLRDFSAGRNYEILMEIYEHATEHCRHSSRIRTVLGAFSRRSHTAALPAS
jgi:glycosyltransferase involved in cell wall biosynthesis